MGSVPVEIVGDIYIRGNLAKRNDPKQQKANNEIGTIQPQSKGVLKASLPLDSFMMKPTTL